MVSVNTPEFQHYMVLANGCELRLECVGTAVLVIFNWKILIVC